MKLGSTIVLRAVVILLGLIFLAICLLALPQLIISELEGDFDYGPIFIGLYITALPYFYALYQTLKLLNLIDKDLAFSTSAISALRVIKQCALIISGLFTIGLPYIFYVGDRDDAPGVVALALVIIGAAFVIATAAAVFQRLFQNAVEIKAENELTV